MDTEWHSYAKGELFEIPQDVLSINIKNAQGDTPLHWQLDRASCPCAGNLLSRGANPLERNDKNRTSRGHIRVVV